MVARSAASTAAAAAATTTTTTTTTGAGINGANKRFKGVRMRSWGRWVSEIRLPNTRARLWLGSYSTAHQAARAFDVAMVCLRGRSAALNFPDSPPSYAPLGLPHHQIQELAASAAAAAASSPSSATSSSPFDSTANTACQLDSPISADSDESEVATNTDVQSWSQSSWALSSTSQVSETAPLSSTSAGSNESEAATTNEMNSSSCSSPVSSTGHALIEEYLLRLDDEAEEQYNSMSSPFAALQEEQALHNMGGGWPAEWEEELLWGCASVSTSYSLMWDQHPLLFPQLPADDDLTAMVEPCLWSL